MRIRLAPGFTGDDLRDALRRHHACLAGGPGRVLKDDRRTRVSAVALADGRAVVVKEYRAAGLRRRLEDLLRPAAPLREWRAAEELARRGVAVARAWALALPWPLAVKSAFVVQEELAAALPVNRYVLGCGAGAQGRARRRALVDAVADWLCALHAAGIEHRDLKGSNLLVREAGETLELFPVDLAEVRFGSRVPEARRAEALAQLSASTPLVVSRSERLRFVARYLGDSTREQRRRLFRRADRLTRARKC
ncbi:MAG: lipopolysaccharide kinase InaA family protein, partial [Myxococcota bacterium]